MKLSPVNSLVNAPLASQPKHKKKESLPDFNPLDYIKDPLEPNNSPYREVKIDGLRLNIYGNLVYFEQDPILKAVQDVYMRVYENGILFSVDGRSWRPFEDLFAFDCDFSFQMKEEGETTELNINLVAETLA